MLANVALFNDPMWVDPAGSAASVAASLESLGHTIVPIATAPANGNAWTAVMGGEEVLVIPELINDYGAVITNSSIISLRDSFLNGGGRMIVLGTATQNAARFVSRLLAPATVQAGNGPLTVESVLQPAAATPFDGAAPSLPSHSITTALQQPSLPPSAITVYAASQMESSVVWAPFASNGGLTYLGWNWAGAAPTGALDGGWLNILDRAAATPAVVQHMLTVNQAGTGSGTVASTPVGIDCGVNCIANYDAGTVVTLTAAPDANATFAGWSGDCAGTGQCVVTIDAARTVTATFTRNQHVLTVSRAGTGSGIVTSSPAGINCGADCTEAYDSGTIVTLIATADTNSIFTGWSGACVGTGQCVVTMDAARTTTATFTSAQRVLTVSKAGTGIGTVTSTPAGINCGADCSEVYDSGTVVTLTAVASVNSTFAGWSGGGCSGTGQCVVTMNATTSVTAAFTTTQHSLTVSKAGTGGGTVTSTPAGINCGADCSEVYDSGAVVTLTAAADPTSTFTGWSGACAGTGQCVVTMDAARSVTAAFGGFGPDTTPPATPPAPDLDPGSDSGHSDTDNITNVVAATIHFSAEPGSRVELHSQNGLDAVMIAPASGMGSFSRLMEEEGIFYFFRVLAQDAAGNRSGFSPPLSVFVDRTAPAMPAAPDLAAASDSGASDSDNITNQTALTLTGTAAADTFLVLYRDGVTAAVLEGDPDQPIVLGSVYNADHVPAGSSARLSFTLTLRDRAGNESARSSATEVIVDRSPPIAVVTGATPTTDATPTLFLLAADDQPIGDGTPASIDVDLNGDGQFSAAGEAGYMNVSLSSGMATVELTPALAAGTYLLRLHFVGFAGNESASRLFSLTIVDTTTPAPPILDFTAVAVSSNPLVTVSGTAEPGSRVEIYRTEDCDGADNDLSVNADGAFSGQIAVALNTITYLSARAFDSAGNPSACTPRAISYLHDDIPSAPPTSMTAIVVDPSDPSGNTVFIATAGGGVWKTTDFVTVYSESTCSTSPLGVARADEMGAVSVALTLPRNASTRLFVAVRDVAGNVSACAVGPEVALTDAPPSIQIDSVAFGGTSVGGQIPITFAVSDDEALPDDATVAFDVDSNNDGDFDDQEELGVVTTTLASVTPEGEIAEDGARHTLRFEGKEWFEVLVWRLGVDQPRTGGSAMGRLEVTKIIDASSPKIMLAALGGKKFDTVSLTSHRTVAGEQEEYLKITLTDVLISSVDPGSSLSGDDRPTEELALNYSKIEWNYKEQKADGRRETHTGDYELPTATAAVTHPPGEEIYTDKYSRIKVQFHWDRESKKDSLAADSLTFAVSAGVGGGLPTGSTATLALPTGGHSASLLAAAVDGKSVPSLAVDVGRIDDGQFVVTGRYIFEDVLISGYQTGVSGSDVPTDTLTINFSRVSYEHVQPGGMGAATGPQTSTGGVDLRNGKWFGHPIPQGPVRAIAPGTSVSFDGDTWTNDVRSVQFDVSAAPSTGRLSTSDFALVMDAGASSPGLLAATGGQAIPTVMVRQHQMIDGQLVLVTEYVLHDVHVTKVEHATMMTAEGVSATQTVMLDPGRVTMRHHRTQPAGGTTTTEFTYDFTTGSFTGPGEITGAGQAGQSELELYLNNGGVVIVLDGFGLDLSVEPSTGRPVSNGLTLAMPAGASATGLLTAAASGLALDGFTIGRYVLKGGVPVRVAEYVLDGVRVTSVSLDSSDDGTTGRYKVKLSFDVARVRSFRPSSSGGVETIETTVDLVTGQTSGPLSVSGALSLSGADMTLSLDGQTAFEVEDFSIDTAGDLVTGSPRLSSFIAVRPLDSLSPKLMLACANGEHIPEVVLTVHRNTAGARDVYLQYTLTDVLVSSYEIGADADGNPVEIVHFVPRTLRVAQIGTAAGGSELIEAEIDFATGEVTGPDEIAGALALGQAPVTAAQGDNPAFALRTFNPRMSTNLSIGRVTVRGWDPVKATKIVDKATPALLAMCCDGDEIEDLAVEFTRPVGETARTYLTWTMTDVLVSSYSVSGQGSGDPIPTESISFNFAKMIVVYQKYDAQGRPAGVETAAWDVELGGNRQGTVNLMLPPVDAAYAVRARVIDDSAGQVGTSPTLSFTVDVANLLPVADPGPDRVARVNQLITLDGTASRDPEGAIVSYEWDTNYNGASFEVDAVGPVVTNYQNDNWDFQGGGTLIALRVTDAEGASHIAVTTLTFQDETPPGVVVVAPLVTTSLTPEITVQVSDDRPLPVGTPVVLNVDLNNDGDFADPGEMAHSTTTLDDIALPDGSIGVHDSLVTLSIGGMGAVAVESWSWGETNSGSHAMPPGSARLNVTVDTSRASPGLLLATLEGRHFPEAILTVHRRVEDRFEPYLQLELENTLVSSWSVSGGGGGGDDRPTESLSLNFTKITYEYKKQDATGGTQTISAEHDFMANRGSGGALEVRGDLTVDGTLQTASFDDGQTAVEVLGFHWGVTQSGTASTASQATFTKRIDQTSAQLFAKSAKGESVPRLSVNLHGIVHNGRVETMQVTFTDVLISSVRPGGSSQGGEPVPLEEVSFNYNKFEIRYKEQNPDFTVQYRETDFNFATRQGSGPQSIEGSLTDTASVQAAFSFDNGQTWSEIGEIQWGLDGPPAVGGGGGGAGKANFQDLHFTMKAGKATPSLMLACATGQHIPKGVISVRKAGDQPVEYLKIEFSDLLISSYQTGGGGGGDSVPTDQISINFSKIEFEYFEQRPDGTTQPHLAEYDSVTEQGSPAQPVQGSLANADDADQTISFDGGASYVSISNMEWGLSRAMAGGPAEADSLDFAMKVNKASPALMLTCANGEHIPEVIITLNRTVDGRREAYLQIKMTDVLISSYQSGGGGESVPTDQVSINFSKIEFEYIEQKADGTIRGHTVQYDFHDGVGSGPLVITGNLEHAEEADEKYASFDGGVSGFEIKDFSFGVENPTTIGSPTGGAGGGKIKFAQFKASPAIMLAVATGRHIPEAAVTLNRMIDGRREAYLIVTFKDLLITSYQTVGIGGGETVPTDEVSFNYSKIEFEYIEQKADGGRQSHEAEYDFVLDQGSESQDIRGELASFAAADATLTMDDRGSWFEIKDFSFGVENPTTIGSATGGGGAGKVQIQDVHFATKVGKASPQLMLACAKGEHIPKVELTLNRTVDGRREPYLTIILEDVLVSSYQTGGSGSSTVPTDQFSLNFSKFEIKYIEQKSDGSRESRTARYDHPLGRSVVDVKFQPELPTTGTYRMQAQVADAAGNVGTSAISTVVVSSDPLMVARIDAVPGRVEATVSGTRLSDRVTLAIEDGELRVTAVGGVLADVGFVQRDFNTAFAPLAPGVLMAISVNMVDFIDNDDFVTFASSWTPAVYDLTVNAGDGNDEIAILSHNAGSTIELDGGGGNDTFKIGGDATGVRAVRGNLTVDGGAHLALPTQSLSVGTATNTLPVGDRILWGDAFDDDPGDVGHLIRVSDGTIRWNNAETDLSLAGIETRDIDGSGAPDQMVFEFSEPIHFSASGRGGNDQFHIVATGQGSNLTVNGDGGSDTFAVSATSATSVSLLNGDDGNDDFRFGSAVAGLDDILGRVGVDGGASDASPTTELTIGGTTNRTRTGNRIMFDDTRPLDRHFFNYDFFVERGAMRVDHTQIQTVTINTGAGNDTIDVVTTAASSNTSINTRDGGDTVTIHNTGAASNVVVNTEGAADLVVFKAAAADGLLRVNTGDHNDIVRVTELENLGNNENWNFGGEHVLVDMGQNGDLPVKLFVAGDRSVSTAVGDTLILDDSTKTLPGDYSLSGPFVSRNGIQLLYDDTETLLAFAGTNSDSFSVGGTEFGSVTIDGRDGNDRVTLIGTPGDDRAIIDGASNTLMIGERPPMTVTGFERTFFDGSAGIDLADVIVEGDASIHAAPSASGVELSINDVDDADDGRTFTFIQVEGLPSVLTTTGRVEIVGDGGQGTVGGGAGADVADMVVFTGTGANAATLTLNGSPPVSFRNLTVAKIDTFDGNDAIMVAPFATSTRLWDLDLSVDGGSGLNTLTYHDVLGRTMDVRLVPTGARRGHIDAAGVVSLVSDEVVAFSNVGDIALVGNLDDDDRLTLTGTSASDPIHLAFNPDGSSTATYTGAGAGITVRTERYESLQLDGREGNDRFTLDATTNLPSVPIRIVGGDPIGLMPGDTLQVLSGTNPVTFKPGPQTDEGGFQVGTGEAISFDQIEMTSLVGGGAASPAPTLSGTASDDQIRLAAVAGGVAFAVNGQTLIEVSQFPAVRVDGLDGDDTIELFVPAPHRIDGGPGTDTLRFAAASQSLDLTALPAGAVAGIERIDMTGAAANTLVVDAQRVRAVSDTGSLRVRADLQDRVQIDGGWMAAGLRLEDGELFSILTQAGATLLVTNPVVGDMDGNQDVEPEDVRRLLMQFVTLAATDRTSGDLNGDRRTNSVDLAILQQNLRRRGLLTHPTEPASSPTAPAPIVARAPSSRSLRAMPMTRLSASAVDNVVSEPVNGSAEPLTIFGRSLRTSTRRGRIPPANAPLAR